MDITIRIPRNHTALMQHLQRQVSHGHYYWCNDQIPAGKLAGFIDKWQHYALRADAPARAYRKQCQRASVHLCLSPDYRPEATDKVDWWMLSTAGKDGLEDGKPTPAKIFDGRTAEGRLRYRDYELVQLVKEVKGGGRSKTITTWTWRLTQARYRAWEALLVGRAKQRDIQGLLQSIACLQAMPMFSGIRAQVVRLIAEANRMLGKVGCAPVTVPNLPVMRMLALWDERAGI